MNDQQAAIKCAELVDAEFHKWLEEKIKDHAFSQFVSASAEDTPALVRAHETFKLAAIVRNIIIDFRMHPRLK